MKKVILILLTAVFLVSCLNDDDQPRFGLEFLPIKSAITPDTLTFGMIDTISIKYNLPNNCYSFNDLYYEVKDTARIVAVRAVVQLDAANCSDIEIEKEFKLTVKASQKQDYVFRFFKGFEADGKPIYEDIAVPVK